MVFNGGPVQRDGALGLGRLAGTTDAGPGLRAVSGGLALVDLDAPAGEVSEHADSLRVFAGHAGWRVGQLEDGRRPGRRLLTPSGHALAIGVAPAADAAVVAVHLPGRRRPELAPDVR